MDTIIGVCVGVGLSAACGFRVFVPLLIASLAARAGYFTPSSDFDWVASNVALVAFGVATLVEIGGYYLPWIDNLLDTIATPAAVVAGIVVTAASITGLDPFLTWTLAIIAGGGVAGTVQAATGMTRLASTATTGGVANPILSTVEAGGSLVLSLLAIVLPVLTGLVVLGLLFFVIRRIVRKRRRDRTPTAVS